METRDKLVKSLTGLITISQRNEKTGEVKIVQSNLVVDGLYEQLTKLLSGDLVTNHISKISFGSNGTTPAVTDVNVTALAPPVWINVTATYPTVTTVRFSASWAANQTHSDTIREIGLFCANNVLAARSVFQGMHKSVGWLWTIQWDLVYSV